MADEYYDIGAQLDGQQGDSLELADARATLAACLKRKEFKVLCLRKLDDRDGGPAEVIVVTCINDQVPSRNLAGIRARERLAFVFRPATDRPPEVRALRRSFPVTMHQNEPEKGAAASLCLYFEPWAAIRRTWTPEKFLSRVLWWLTATARSELHRADQPVEQLYFDSPFEVVFPPNYDQALLDKSREVVFKQVRRSDGTVKVLNGVFVPKNANAPSELRKYVALVLTLPPLIHSTIQRFPLTLGSLNDDLASRGVDLLSELERSIRDVTPQSGIAQQAESFCLLVLRTPIQRNLEDKPERIEVRAALIKERIGLLGAQVGALHLQGNNYYAIQLLPGTQKLIDPRWREAEICQIEVKEAATRHYARVASGVAASDCEFKAVLAGVGALGSAMLDIWICEGWGNWTIIDPDTVEPHNVVRHVSKALGVGHFKVDIAAIEVEAKYLSGEIKVRGIVSSASNCANAEVRGAITEAALFVDASTTLEVPREWSLRSDTPRSASVFLTPSGKGSVLLIEDAAQRIRLDAIEAQYYRAIVNSDWGADHLTGHFGHVWVGAGCRDVSNVVPVENVRLHAALLAKGVRISHKGEEARIAVWTFREETGAIESHIIEPSPTSHATTDDWRIVWDQATVEKLERMRFARLPSETGGVIVGYIDHAVFTIYIVDVLPPTSDSKGDQTGFVRGVKGLNEELERIRNVTGNVVDYIGEWHSHPPRASALPSCDDVSLLQHLADTLAQEGEPALMMIVGEQQLSIIIGGQEISVVLQVTAA